jgi:hypothetical protein
MEAFKESYMGESDASNQLEQKIQEIYEMYKTDATITKEEIEELKIIMEIERRKH